MVGIVLVGGVLITGLIAIVYALNRANQADLARSRLQASGTDGSDDDVLLPVRASRIMRRYRWAALPAGLMVGVVLWWTLHPPWSYATAFGLMAGMLFWQAESWFFQRRLQKTEQQLVDSIDMMVAAVKSGASLQGAMESAMENTRAPWSDELQEVVGRIRYGDDPTEVLTELSERIPLESVRLFAQSLAVNWSVGGRLSITLANVGRTIRDRLELTRRMHAMTTQSRVSVISVIMVTYFIGALMWRNDPDRMDGFLRSLVGQGLVTTAMILQAVGIVWISRLGTPKF